MLCMQTVNGTERALQARAEVGELQLLGEAHIHFETA
jgi:hypothetical protein